MSQHSNANMFKSVHSTNGGQSPLSTQTGALVIAIAEELNGLPMAEDLAPHRLSDTGDQSMPHYRVLMDTLTGVMFGSKWPTLRLDAAVVRVFYDYVFTGSPVLVTAAVPAIVPLLWPITLLLAALPSPTSTQVLAIKSRAFEGIARLFCLIDEHPREYLDIQGFGRLLVESITVLELETDFKKNANYDNQTVRKITSYGFFLADNHADRQIWFDVDQCGASSVYIREEPDVFFEKFGMGTLKRVISVLLSWLEKHTVEGKSKYGHKIAIPLFWLLGEGYIPLRDAFWGQLAVPLSNHWWSRQADSVPLEIRSTILVILCHAFQGTWISSKSREVCVALATLDLASILSQLCYLGVCLKSPLWTFRVFATAFSRWIEYDPLLSTQLKAILRPTLEPMFLSSLDKMVLASLTLTTDTANNSSDEARDSGHTLSGIDCWMEFGTTLGLDEAKLREGRREKKLKASPGLLGCSWKRCPVFTLHPSGRCSCAPTASGCNTALTARVRKGIGMRVVTKAKSIEKPPHPEKP